MARNLPQTHIPVFIPSMKTTLDLPDELLIEAKTLAVRRRTSLKALVVEALRKEIHPRPYQIEPDKSRFEVNELGMLVLKKKRDGAATVTSDSVRDAQHVIDEEDRDRARESRHP